MSRIHVISFFNHLINCYLIEEMDGLTLIDTGYSFCYKKILKCADMIGKPIKKVVITHLHSDHIGGLKKIYKFCPEIQIYVPAKDYELLKTRQNLLTYPVEIKLYGYLKQSDKIGSLTVIDTPGHTQGSVSFYHPESKSLFCGDAFQTAGGFAIAGEMRLMFPFVALATWNRNIAKASAEKIVHENDIKQLLPGHGKKIFNMKENINRRMSK
ncbi:MAG: MBL fold metallo-hydrolase [Clostridiales bacterium]|nr:MBL fold metallo-hydrolase [Clostridiales bacterium]